MRVLGRAVALGFLLFSLSSPVWADPPVFKEPYEVRIEKRNGAEVVVLNSDQGWVQFGEVEIFPKGKELFHWASDASVGRWISQGHIDSGEVDYFIEKGSGAVGGGIYYSEDPLDSIGYGRRVAVTRFDSEVKAINEVSEYAYLIKWKDLIPELKKLGIQLIDGYNSDRKSWVNFIDSRPLARIREGNAKDILAVNRPRWTFNELFELDSRYPVLPDDPALAQKFPLLTEFLKAKALSPDLKDRFKTESDFVSWATDYPNGLSQRKSTPLIQRILPAYRNEFIEEFKIKTSIDGSPYQPSVGLGDRSMWIGAYVPLSKNYRIPIQEWMPGAQIPKALFDRDPVAESSLPQQDYGKKLAAAFEFMDPRELLSAVAQGDPEPWKRADLAGALASALDRWKELSSKEDMSEQISTMSASEYLSIRGSSAQPEYRDQPAQSAGDIVVDGKSYSKMSEYQKLWLEQNPFLWVESIETSETGSDGKKLYLVRYEHPSAANFEHFAEVMDPKFLQILRNAQKSGQLSDTSSGSFRDFTSKMLVHLENFFSQGELPEWNGESLRRYQIWMGLRPLKSGNGNVARWLLQGSYQNESLLLNPGYRWWGSERFHPSLLDWERDWALPLPDLVAKADEGAVQFRNLISGLRRAEEKNPQFPRYFDVPEIWEVGLQRRATPGQEAQFVEQAKARFKAGVLPDSPLSNPCAAAYRGIGH